MAEEENTIIEKKYYTIGVLAKACTVLETLATRQNWELADLSRAVKLPKTTVHRILLTLEDSGFVLQEYNSKRYYLSHKLFSLGSSVLAFSNLRDIARPFCKDLLALFDETVNLCLISGVDMVIVDKQVTSQTLRPDNLVGSCFPIFYSASGKAVLAFSEQTYFEETLKKIKRDTVPTISEKDFNDFLEELEQVRQSGVGYDNEEIFSGVRCVAAPIFDHSEKSIAAISITAPTIRLSEDVIKKIEYSLRCAARDISKRLGSNHEIYQNI